MEKRSFKISDVRAEQNEDSMKLGGYFIVFNDETELYQDVFEKVDSSALDKTLDNDIRCLFNHDAAKVLGRTKNNTLKLTKDEKGIYGEVIINPNDSEAVSVYRKVERGDIDQCSFGFNILNETQTVDEKNRLHVTLTEVDLHEVSIVTFPAYNSTQVSAREKMREEMIEQHKKEQMEKRRNALLERITKWQSNN